MTALEGINSGTSAATWPVSQATPITYGDLLDAVRRIEEQHVRRPLRIRMSSATIKHLQGGTKPTNPHATVLWSSLDALYGIPVQVDDAVPFLQHEADWDEGPAAPNPG